MLTDVSDMLNTKMSLRCGCERIIESYAAIEVTLRCIVCMIFSKSVTYLTNQNCKNIKRFWKYCTVTHNTNQCLKDS